MKLNSMVKSTNTNHLLESFLIKESFGKSTHFFEDYSNQEISGTEV